MKRVDILALTYAFLVGCVLAFAVYETLSGVADLGALKYAITHQCKGAIHD